VYTAREQVTRVRRHYTAMYTACTGSLHGSYTSVYGPVHGRVDGRCAAACGPCTRPCKVLCARYTAAVYTAVDTSSPAKTARTRPYNGRAVYTIRTRLCMGSAHGPSTPPVYMTVYGPSVRTTDVFGRVHGEYTAPYTGRVHGHVRAVHTAVYTTRIRPRTRVYVCKGRVHRRVRAIYTAENGRIHSRTRPCNVSCIRPCMGRTASCTRQCTGRVHGRFRPWTLAVYTAVFGRLHIAYTAV